MVMAAKEIEEAMLGMRSCLAAVAAPSREKEKITWVGTVDIGLVQLLRAVPRYEADKKVSEQEEALTRKCSEFLAVKLHGALQATCKAWKRSPTI